LASSKTSVAVGTVVNMRQWYQNANTLSSAEFDVFSKENANPPAYQNS
jgi:hypothetical protein